MGNSRSLFKHLMRGVFDSVKQRFHAGQVEDSSSAAIAEAEESSEASPAARMAPAGELACREQARAFGLQEAEAEDPWVVLAAVTRHLMELSREEFELRAVKMGLDPEDELFSNDIYALRLAVREAEHQHRVLGRQRRTASGSGLRL